MTSKCICRNLIHVGANSDSVFIISKRFDMSNENKLLVVKIVHTLIWIFFNVVIFYMLYTVIVNRLDKWLWVGYGLVFIEGITLLLFKYVCPLTLIARKYSDSRQDNFDIFLPNWLARNTKLIYTSILVLIIALTIYRFLE